MKKFWQKLISTMEKYWKNLKKKNVFDEIVYCNFVTIYKIL